MLCACLAGACTGESAQLFEPQASEPTDEPAIEPAIEPAMEPGESPAESEVEARVELPAAPSPRRPSIWGGVESALYHVELDGRAPDGLVLQGLTVARGLARRPEANLLVRIHLEYPDMEQPALGEALAELLTRLGAQRGVRSCQADYELTQAEREAGVSAPVIALGLELPDAPELDPEKRVTELKGETAIRAASADKAVQPGRIDIVRFADHSGIRPGSRGRGTYLGSLKAFAQLLEAMPEVVDVQALHVMRSRGDRPPAQLWEWELEVLLLPAEG